MSRQSTSQGIWPSVGWGVGSLVLLIFLPLILSGVEYYTLGSSHVEDVCRQLGIYNLLTRIYEPLFRLFKYLLR